MRVLLKANMSTGKCNELAREGNLGRTIQTIIEELQPEVVYFTADAGHRTAYLVVQIQDSSEIPKIAEPWFLALDSNVELHPVMNLQDLSKAESAINRAGQQY